jgi:hypothetical protein
MLINSKYCYCQVGIAFLTFAAGVLGCSGPSGELTSGGPTGSGAITRTLRWHQDSGAEVLQCHTFKLDNLTSVEVNRIRFQFGGGSHHVHIYRSTEPEADGVVDCSQGISWPRWRLVAGAQTTPLDWQLPEGLTVPLDPQQQLLVQVHWLNTSPAARDEKIDITFFTALATRGHVGVMFGVNKQVAMQPGDRKTLKQWCPLPSGSRLVAMMGHFHTLGRRYSVSMRPRDQIDGGSVIYDGLDENTLVFQSWPTPLPVPSGSGLDFTCEFQNFRNHPISWGADTETQEHCNLATYYFPADEASSFCIKEVDDVGMLAGVTPSARSLQPGQATTVAIRMEPAVEGDTDVALAVSDPTALEAPAVARIPAGQTTGMVKVKALRPVARVSVTASIAGQRTQADLSVGGLAISELMAAPAAGQKGGRWIEISNTASIPIDLSRYRIGAGRTSYDELRVPMSNILPPFGCLLLAEAAGEPLAVGEAAPLPLGAHLLPLPPGLAGSGGIALLETIVGHEESQPSPEPLPLDALVYGTGEGAGLIDSTGQAAPVVKPGVPGSSLARQADGQWRAQLVPTPGICEVRL